MSKNVRIDYGDGMEYKETYYLDSDQLCWKGVFVNGAWYGYFERYYKDGSVDWTRYFLNSCKVSDDNDKGYCLIWDKVIV